MVKFLPLLLFAAISPAIAQTTDSTSPGSVKSEVINQDPLIGKTLTYMFGRAGCNDEFFTSPPDRSTQRNNERRYTAKAPASFVVEKTIERARPLPLYPLLGYYQLRFQDGTEAYVDNFLFTVSDIQNDYSVQVSCIFAATLEVVKARTQQVAVLQEKIERGKAQALETYRRAQEEQSRRPGVRIGMSAREVREKTHWGEPEKINRTVSESGVTEQWVYGLNEYLYFRNGRVHAIQTSR